MSWDHLMSYAAFFSERLEFLGQGRKPRCWGGRGERVCFMVAVCWFKIFFFFLLRNIL